MKSHTTARFRRCLERLPIQVRLQAQDAYRLFSAHPDHPGLRFKKIHPTRPVFSVRIGIHYRALGVREGEDIVWYWIGSHADYDDEVQRGG